MRKPRSRARWSWSPYRTITASAGKGSSTCAREPGVGPTPTLTRGCGGGRGQSVAGGGQRQLSGARAGGVEYALPAASIGTAADRADYPRLVRRGCARVDAGSGAHGWPACAAAAGGTAGSLLRLVV